MSDGPIQSEVNSGQKATARHETSTRRAHEDNMADPAIASEDPKAELCRRLIEGESLRTICADAHMPSKPTVCRWLAADEAFQAEYRHAREMQGEALAEEILAIADTPVAGSKTTTKGDGTIETVEADMIEHRRLRVDARKWVASKLYPKKYGDSTMLKHADAEGSSLKGMNSDEIAVRLASICAAIQQNNHGKGS